MKWTASLLANINPHPHLPDSISFLSFVTLTGGYIYTYICTQPRGDLTRKPDLSKMTNYDVIRKIKDAERKP